MHLKEIESNNEHQPESKKVPEIITPSIKHTNEWMNRAKQKKHTHTSSDLEGINTRKKKPSLPLSNCYCYNFNVSYSMGMMITFFFHWLSCIIVILHLPPVARCVSTAFFRRCCCCFSVGDWARAHVTESHIFLFHWCQWNWIISYAWKW